MPMTRKPTTGAPAEARDPKLLTDTTDLPESTPSAEAPSKRSKRSTPTIPDPRVIDARAEIADQKERQRLDAIREIAEAEAIHEAKLAAKELRDRQADWLRQDAGITALHELWPTCPALNVNNAYFLVPPMLPKKDGVYVKTMNMQGGYEETKVSTPFVLMGGKAHVLKGKEWIVAPFPAYLTGSVSDAIPALEQLGVEFAPAGKRTKPAPGQHQGHEVRGFAWLLISGTHFRSA